MAWPTSSIPTSNLDLGSDSPALARADILQMAQAMNDIIAIPSADGVSLISAANYAAMRTLLGALTSGSYGNQECLIIAVSDETTDLTTGTAKVTFCMPYNFNLVKVKASVGTVSSSGNPAFDLNDDGVSVFSTTVSIDSGEKFSDTAVTASVLTSTPLAIASGSLMTIDIDTAGTGAKGAKLYLIGYATGAA